MTEQEVRAQTNSHIRIVKLFLSMFSNELLFKAEFHDNSKLEEPEFSIFREYTEKLKDSTYGSPEYLQFLKDMKPALDHHYQENKHHPEHFENGIAGMNLADLVEMFCDWKAASLRHANGDIKKSIDINAERFGMSPQLKQIFLNSIGILGE